MNNANPAGDPPIDDQVAYWNDWNMRFRKVSQKLDAYQERQLATAKRWLSGETNGKVIEIGCGTGWLSAALAMFVSIVGMDLSTDAVEEAKRRGSSATFLAGEFLGMNFPEKFNMVITVDTMAHVPDHAAFIDKVSSVLVPGGVFLLMTQNSFVWNRSSQLMPLAKGQVRQWPQLADLRKLLAPDFRSM
jgi:2-polyprenyl-3-methyl-5-hydroxy-6-metoxy-1,4-benzoquinol methylase